MSYIGFEPTILPDGIVLDINVSSVANISDLKLATISTAGKVLNSATSANTSDVPSTLVLRDEFGSFSANVITAHSFIGVTSNAVVTNLNADYLDGHSSEYFTANSDAWLHVTSNTNPHAVTATQVSLGNVTNESKATMFTDATFTGNTVANSIYISSDLMVTGNTVANSIYISGDLIVAGNTTSIHTTNLIVADKNIELGKVDTPSDLTANNGGITLKGTSDKTIIWESTSNNWTSSENFNIVTDKEYKINNVSVLNANTLGSSVLGSYLTSVGNVASGTWSSFFGVVSGANLTNLTANNIVGTIPSNVIFTSNVFIGTTQFPLNRTSATQTLLGVNIDGASNTSTNLSGGFVSATTGDFSDTVTITTNTASPAITISQTGSGSAISSNGFVVTRKGDITVKHSKINTEFVSIDDTANNLIYSYNNITYRTVELLAQVSDVTNSEYHSTKILLLHNSGNVYKVEYGSIATTELGNFYSNLNGSNVELYFAATDTSDKEIKVFATMLTS
jgi:hypothetical protein